MATYFERPERGWTPIPTELIHTTELSPVARLVLMHALSNRADWEEPAWKIAERLGLSRERVINALGELKKTGNARKTATVTVPGRPPLQGWDFAWPAFVEVDSQSRILPSSGNPTMEESLQVEPKVGFCHDGEIHRRETPSSGNPTSGNPSPLLDQPSNETVVPLDQLSNETKTPLPPAPEEAPKVTMLDFNKIPIPTESTTVGNRPPKRARLKYDYDEHFLAAWEAYGRVGGKQQAWQAWKNANGRVSPSTIMAAIPHYLASDQPQRGYTQHFSTWLNNDGWESASAQPKKPGYQGKAGSDIHSLDGEMERAKVRPICKLMRTGPMTGELDWNRAWYYHWNVAEQRDWTEEQLLATGNSPEDVMWLMDAYLDGIDPDLYARMKRDADITEEA